MGPFSLFKHRDGVNSAASTSPEVTVDLPRVADWRGPSARAWRLL